MLLTLDQPFIDRIVADESAQAKQELAQLGPVQALARSQVRHDERLAAAPDAHTLACKQGCFWCCYFSVDVRAVEVLRIIEFMEATFTVEERERVRREARTNRTQLAGADEVERMQRNVKCPFLQQGRCSIYAVRPQTCRNYHATDAAGCQQSFENPENLDIDPEFAPLIYQTGGAHVDAFALALRAVGFDVAVYELNAALSEALAAPEALRRRFMQKSRPFETLAGTTAPIDFADDDE